MTQCLHCSAPSYHKSASGSEARLHCLGTCYSNDGKDDNAA